MRSVSWCALLLYPVILCALISLQCYNGMFECEFHHKIYWHTSILNCALHRRPIVQSLFSHFFFILNSIFVWERIALNFSFQSLLSQERSSLSFHWILFKRQSVVFDISRDFLGCFHLLQIHEPNNKMCNFNKQLLFFIETHLFTFHKFWSYEVKVFFYGCIILGWI